MIQDEVLENEVKQSKAKLKIDWKCLREIAVMEKHTSWADVERM